MTEKNAPATAAVILGLVGVPAAAFFVGGWFGLVVGCLSGFFALSLGIVGLARARRDAGAGRGLATWGVALGVFTLLVSAVMTVFYVVPIGDRSNADFNACMGGAHTDADRDACRNQFGRDLDG
jgi:uncharacterized membrane protein